MSRSSRRRARLVSRLFGLLNSARRTFWDLAERHGLTLVEFDTSAVDHGDRDCTWFHENQIYVIDRGSLRLTFTDCSDEGTWFEVSVGTPLAGTATRHAEHVTLEYHIDGDRDASCPPRPYGEWQLSRGDSAASAALLAEIDLGFAALLRNDPRGDHLHVRFGVDLFDHDPRSPSFTPLLDRMLRHFSLAK